MNERIREVAIRAYEICNKRTYGSIHSQEEFNQTFAELIVQECAKIARQDILSRSGMNQQYDGRVITEDAIKNYFGVN